MRENILQILSNFKPKRHLAVFFILVFSTIIISLMLYQFASANSIQIELATNQGLVGAWKRIIGITNSLVILILIVVAFSEILRIQIDTYAVKKILPTIILAVVAANFSFLICRIFVDFGNVAVNAFLTRDPLGRANSLLVDNWGNWDWEENFFLAWIMASVFLLFDFVLLIALLILTFLFFIRGYVIYFLVVVSPIAFMAISLPVTKRFFDQWMGQFMRWVFLPVPSVALLWLMGVFIQELPQDSPLLSIAFSVIALYGAIVVPFQLGGPIMQKWGGIGKKWAGSLGGNAVAKWGANKYNNTKRTAGNWARNLPGIKNIDRAIGRGNIRQDLIDRQFAKKDKVRGFSAAFDYYNRMNADPTYWSKHPDEHSRMKVLMGEIVADELDPSYRESKSLGVLRGQMVLVDDGKGGRKAATATEIAAGRGPFYKISEDGTEKIVNPADYQDSQSRMKMFQESAAAISEIKRRAKSKSTWDIDDGSITGGIGGTTPKSLNDAITGKIADTRILSTSAVGTPVNKGQAAGGRASSDPIVVEVSKIHDKHIEEALAHINEHSPEMERLAGIIHDGGIEGYNQLKEELTGSNAASVVERLNPGLSGAGAEDIAAALAKYKTAVGLMDHAPQHLERIEKDGIQQGLADIRKSLEQSAASSAANAAVGNAAVSHLSGQSGTINSITSNEDTMRAIASTLGELHQSIDGLKDRPTLDHKELAAVLKEAMVGMVPRGGNGGNTSISALVGNSEADRRRFADTLGKYVAKHTAELESKRLRQAPTAPTN